MKRTAAASLLLALSACTTVQPGQIAAADNHAAAPSKTAEVAPARAGEPLAPTAYSVLHASHVGLEQIFDDGRAVFLVFAQDRDALQYRYYDQDGKAVSVKASGRYAVIAGIHKGLLVRNADGYTYAQPARVAGGEAPTLPQRLSAEQAALRAATLQATNMEPAKVTRAGDGLASNVVRIYFPTGNAHIRLSQQARLELAAKAADAKTIIIRGRTDNTGPMAANTAIAKQRAMAAARLVRGHGVPKNAITIRYAPMTDYIATNDTEEGRALNRRAEIEFEPKS